MLTTKDQFEVGVDLWKRKVLRGEIGLAGASNFVLDFFGR